VIETHRRLPRLPSERKLNEDHSEYANFLNDFTPSLNSLFDQGSTVREKEAIRITDGELQRGNYPISTAPPIVDGDYSKLMEYEMGITGPEDLREVSIARR
jgi:hypothetical protein